MRKFDAKFKERVVREYLAGKGGYKLLAAKFGVAESMVRRWVAAYRHHGNAGLIRQRGAYTIEFKLEVVHRGVAENLSCRELAAIYNIGNLHSIRMWQQQKARGELRSLKSMRPSGRDVSVPAKKKTSNQSLEAPRSDESDQLLRENQQLRCGGRVPKKIQCLGSSKEVGSAEIAKIVLELRQEFPLTDLLQAARLPRSTYYYRVKTLATPDRHGGLKAKIQAVYAAHRGLYGYRRITLTIRSDGELVNRKKVQRLMNELGIRSRVRRKKFRSYQGEIGEAAPNLLNREFTASGPNEKWVTDVTEFRVAGKKLYLSPVMDLYNGEIFAYESSHRPDFPMVMGMLRKSVKKHGNAATPMLHSDQGWHYRMQPYRAALARYGMKQSMSRKGNCFDNAAMESFFGTLKAEYFHLSDFEDVDALRVGLKGYIDYYNRHRIKSKLGGMSPVEYRMRAGKN